MARAIKDRISALLKSGGFRGGKLQGLTNDARYWDLVRTHGEYSSEVLRHLESCSDVQRRDANHT